MNRRPFTITRIPKNQTKNQQKIYYFEFTFQDVNFLTKKKDHKRYNGRNRKN